MKWEDIHAKKRQFHKLIISLRTGLIFCFVFRVQGLGKEESFKSNQTNIFLGMFSELDSITFLDRRCKD